MTSFPDSTGPPVCELCDKRFPVSSLARACETNHLTDPEHGHPESPDPPES